MNSRFRKFFFPFLVGSLAFVMSSCLKSHYEREITGNWWGVDWQVNGESQPGRKQIWFQFNQDSTYASVFGGLSQNGKFWVDGYRLYTHAEGEDPIVVKIVSLRDDTMTIEMNRAGQPEVLVLAKKEE